MHSSEGIRAAMLTLSGLYIYDYCPSSSIRARTIERFQQAELRFSRLINDKAKLEADEAGENITLAIIMSMQDVSYSLLAQ